MKRPSKKMKDKLVLQLFICIVLFGSIFAIEKMNFSPADEAMSVFKKQMEKDYTVSEIADETISLGKAIIEKPAQVYANLMDRTGTEEFIIPTDELTASVFEKKIETNGTADQNSGDEIANTEGKIQENTLEFISEDEIIVYAAKGGVVAEIVKNNDETNTLVLSHDGHISTKYMGCTDVYVKELQRVKKGEIIASVKNGKLNQLQFEIWDKDTKADPSKYIKLK